MSRNRVSNLGQLQERSEELKREGFVAVRPGDFTSGSYESKVFSWNDYVHSMLVSPEFSTAGTAGSASDRRQVSTIFASSGGENKAKPENIGTPGLGYMEWGVNNRLPNLVWMLSRMSPFTAAGIDFIKRILVGRGPQPKYRYTQYVGGNITEKYIPYETAGVLLRGRIAELQAREEARRAENEERKRSENNLLDNILNSPSQEDSEEIKELKSDYEKWKQTNMELHQFMEDNDLMTTYLDLAGDLALMSQCFVEVQLNQRQIGEDGAPVPTSLWKPKITGIRSRSIFTTRLERMDKNYRINYAYISNRWLDSTQMPVLSAGDDIKMAAVPFLAAHSAVKDLQSRIREARQKNVSRKNRPTRFIMSPRDYGGPYYANALWHSIFAGSIFEYAFTIVDDRLTRKRNSNIIGRVIYIHQDYLNALYRQQGDKKDLTMAQIQQQVFSDINTWLSNPDNAGQALISSVFTGPDGKEHKAWEIVEIESKQKDRSEAEKTELQEISSIIFFAMGLDSKLIGNTPGDASSSGGTDLRERFLVKQIQFAPLQQLMLSSLSVVSGFNEWDSHLVWQIDREVLTTLDNSKTGITSQE